MVTDLTLAGFASSTPTPAPTTWPSAPTAVLRFARAASFGNEDLENATDTQLLDVGNEIFTGLGSHILSCPARPGRPKRQNSDVTLRGRAVVPADLATGIRPCCRTQLRQIPPDPVRSKAEESVAKQGLAAVAIQPHGGDYGSCAESDKHGWPARPVELPARKGPHPAAPARLRPWFLLEGTTPALNLRRCLWARPGSNRRQPRCRSRASPHPGTFPHPGHHRWRHSEPARGLQTHHHQAVPQARTSTTDRDHDQGEGSVQGCRGGGPSPWVPSRRRSRPGRRAPPIPRSDHLSARAVARPRRTPAAAGRPAGRSAGPAAAGAGPRATSR
jgi:hypothetical protein